MLGRFFASITVALLTVGCASAPPKMLSVDAARTASGHVPADEPHFSLPATVAASTALTDPRPVTAAEQFDHALARLADNQPPESLAMLPPEERDLISAVVDAIAGFRNGLADPNALMQTKTASLVALSQQLDSQLPLEIPTLALCKSVQQFGIYDAIDPPKFIAGKLTPVIIYCELAHFRSRPASDARWETKLSYEAVLYRDGDDAMPVLSKKPTEIIDHCRNRRRDFFLADRMSIPSNLGAGRYLLKVTIVDKIANHVAEKTAAIVVAP
jgi:hypothetical protein